MTAALILALLALTLGHRPAPKFSTWLFDRDRFIRHRHGSITDISYFIESDSCGTGVKGRLVRWEATFRFFPYRDRYCTFFVKDTVADIPCEDNLQR